MMLFCTDSAYKTGILSRKKDFILILVSKIWPKRKFLPILGDFGGHFEKPPLFGSSRIFRKICYIMLLLTDSENKTGILTRKKKRFHPHFSVQNMAKKGNFLPALGHFGGHFEKRPLFGVSRIF